MPRTPDRTPGPAIEEELQLEDRTSDGNPTIDGAIRYVSDDVVVKLSTGVTSLTSGSGLSAGTHRTLDQLVHEIAETSYQEVTRSAGKVVDITYWTNSGKTTKIREVNITRTAGKVSSVEIIQYDGAGSVAETLTGTVTRAGGSVASIDWVLS